MSNSEDLSSCIIMNTVAASRLLLRRYDARLRYLGVTVQQFYLLAAIRSQPGEPVSVLARKVLLDRTSLTRNLDLLERKGLVRRRDGQSGNRRVCELTQSGTAVLDELLPQWRKAKAELMQGLSDAEVETYLKVARHLARD